MAGLHGKKRMFVCVLLAGVFVLISVWSIVHACTVTSVSLSVSDVSEDDAENNSSGSTTIPVGDEAYVYASCGFNENPNDDGIEWTFDLDANGSYETTYSTTYDALDEYLGTTETSETFADTGDFTLRVKARLDDGEDTWEGPATCDVTVVGVESVVKDGTTDEGPIFVNISDGSVGLEAIPDPDTATFPGSKPTWSITSRPSAPVPWPGSLSTFSGTTTTLNNITLVGDYTVKATCGTSNDSITITAFEGEADPAIEDAEIERSPDDRVWFHIKDDPLTLTAIARDGDTGDGTLSYDYLENVDIYYDYIDLEATGWSGSADLSDTEGVTTTWTPQSPNSAGVKIKATIDDDADIGYGDDDPKDIETPLLYAYRVGVDVDRSWTSDNLYAEPTTTSESSDSQSFWEDSDLDSISYTGGLSHLLFADEDEEKLSRQKVIKMTWTLVTDPTGAELGVKRVKTVANASDNGGTIRGVVMDTDIDDGSSSISVGISGGGGGFSAGVSTTITWGTDENEGYAGGGWAFSGDEFSDLADNGSQKYALISSDFPEGDLPASASTSGSVGQSKPFVGLHGETFKSKYEVEGRASRVDVWPTSFGWGKAESLRTGTYETERPFLYTPPAP